MEDILECRRWSLIVIRAWSSLSWRTMPWEFMNWPAITDTLSLTWRNSLLLILVVSRPTVVYTTTSAAFGLAREMAWSPITRTARRPVEWKVYLSIFLYGSDTWKLAVVFHRVWMRSLVMRHWGGRLNGRRFRLWLRSSLIRGTVRTSKSSECDTSAT